MRKTLIAKNGFFYTDGQSYGRIIDLAEGDDGKQFYQITESEYYKLTAEEEEYEER